jgi:hypothetical protein
LTNAVPLGSTNTASSELSFAMTSPSLKHVQIASESPHRIVNIYLRPAADVNMPDSEDAGLAA